MATYKEIKGTQIEAVATDPSNPVEGQVWYNTTDNVLKGFKLLATGSWSTVNSMNTSRYYGSSSNTSGTASITFAGGIGPSSTYTLNSETWNGTNWTEVNNLSTGRNQLAGLGTQTSALAIGGNTYPGPPAITNNELWNGTNWTEVNDINTGRRLMPGTGADNTSGLITGGLGPPTYTITESWNGTNWTEVNDLNSARYQNSMFGTATAALTFAGDDTPDNTVTESWNGTNWTEVNNLNTGVKSAAAAGYNSNTSGLKIGGAAPGGSSANTEEWNGTNWTEVNNLNTARQDLAGGGNTSSAIVSGGDPATAIAEQWSGTTPSTVTFTDS